MESVLGVQVAVDDNPPSGGWTNLIDDTLAGRWVNREPGSVAEALFDQIAIAAPLTRREVGLVCDLHLGRRLAVAADHATFAAMGCRVASALEAVGPVTHVTTADGNDSFAEAAELTFATRRSTGGAL